MRDIYIHPHALARCIPEDEILAAWSNFVRSQQRLSPREEQCLRAGCGKTVPTPIQMVGVAKPFGTLVIHAMTPPQDSVLDELGMPRRQR